MTRDHPGAWRATALAAVTAAGRLQRERARLPISVERKGHADIVTDVDRDCETAVVTLLRERHPEHDVLGEEGTTPDRRARRLWILDPLDGTKNYAHGYARSCVSLGLAVDGEVVLGAVYNARADELFLAELGGGAARNGQPIHVSPVEELARSMVASALTYEGSHRQADRAQLERLARVLGAAEAVRSDGCAALDLCDVACGRFEAYFERGLHAWDTAAGSLIVREAGGKITNFSGAPHDLYAAETFASNALIHEELARLL